jgi:hypothetical protein
MQSTPKPFTLVAAGLLALTTACASTSGRTVADGGATTLIVRNHNFSDMNIYAVGTGGPRLRLGVAPGETTTRFMLPVAAIVPGPMRIGADPIGGLHGVRSDPVIANAGDTVTFTIEQNLALSVATVR